MLNSWNPWHGCIKKSEGCEHCYMYFLDKQRNKDGSLIFKTFDNSPIKKDKNGNYKVKSGETVSVCMTSDFFLEEADSWRKEAWNIIKKRSDIVFFLITKRPERILKCLPEDWDDGLENVFLNITTENQKRVDERIPILLDLPFKHKGLMVAPFLEEITINKYLKENQIEQVCCGGENYDGSRVLDYNWVLKLSNECKNNNITFCFTETGNKFRKDGKLYMFNNKFDQSRFALKCNLNFVGKKIDFKLSKKDDLFLETFGTEVYKKYFKERCNQCSFKMLCNGCSNCGKCHS